MQGSSDVRVLSLPSPLRGGTEGGGPSVAHRITSSPALLRPLRAERRYPPLKGEGRSTDAPEDNHD